MKRKGAIRVYTTKTHAEASMKAIVESLIKTSNQLKDEENAKTTPEGGTEETEARVPKPRKATSKDV